MIRSYLTKLRELLKRYVSSQLCSQSVMQVPAKSWEQAEGALPAKECRDVP